MNNNTKLIYLCETVKINENTNINITLNEKRNNKFFDVVLNLKNKEIFLGRFIKEFNKISAKYNEGKILIFCDEFDQKDRRMKISEVLSLYEVVDDTFYSCTEIEALNIFDNSLDTSFLKKPHNPIHRSDIEKNKRLYR